ncbi:hypothetical protein, partial [uncultured Agitococcus sp.]|uniref:hypothetical protein n=1 Tax=uncultured Agitococcus sp. TaxID=1506599 RepID=UPI00260FE006
VFKFVHTHLRSISRKPKEIQQTLLDNLLGWYQESINPKPKIIPDNNAMILNMIMTASFKQQDV